ncbi:MAG: urate hydroxylase PuuD [Archangium sp.]|nr:urate hydroxylase PuuD [Archangium sp.]MDP3572263.1 urate hydroxylase PuuD [Archangium sp.]
MTVHEFLDLLIRWVHLIAGIMWIGNSMLFNWLDRNLEKAAGRENEVGYEGKMWMVHSGGFYEVEKRQLSPGQMPKTLHWFKWQNFSAWASGIALLIVVYYLNGGAYLIDPSVRALGLPQAIALSVLSLVLPFTVYHFMWRTIGKSAPTVAGLVSIGALLTVTYALTQMFSGRAAYLHVGVLLGTVMTGNVWMVIVPSQRKLVAATESGQEQDYALNQRAKQRSIHNNYMTFPLLFIMLSNHFPGTYSHPLNWLVLFVLMFGGAGVRHFMNIRYSLKSTAAWLGPIVAILVVSTALLFGLTARPAVATPPPSTTALTPDKPKVAFAQVNTIIQARCTSCHSAKPTEPMFPVAPTGVMFDSPEQIVILAPRIKDRAVVTRTMPFINKTGMADDERELLGRWVDEGAHGP